MRRLALVAALGLVACGDGPAIHDPPADGMYRPGETYSLQALVATQAAGKAVSWSVVEPDGGTIDAAGHYTAPPCSVLVSGYTPTQLASIGGLSAPAHVLASWDGGSLSITITVAEAFDGIRVDPASVTLLPSGAANFVAYNKWTCHESRAPNAP